MITKQEFSKTVRIYKSHPLKNGLISITYCDILGYNTISVEKTIVAQKHGGTLNSLYIYECGC